MPRRQRYLEIACIAAVFFLDAAVLPPDVNEPYYLGKALHFWNPGWAAGDFFLQTADTHKLFYGALGWLGLWLPLPAMAWTIRLLAWGLLAWAWQRLSYTLIARRWMAVLSAALFALLVRRFHLSGEWVLGGAEGKPFAFVLVFLALAALARGQWNRTWLLLGAATAIHVLVGGWSAVAVGLAWLLRPAARAPLLRMLPALAAAVVLALPGLWPALTLNRGMDPALQQKANEIYVFQRLDHHLQPLAFPLPFVARFALLAGVWLWLTRREHRQAERDPAMGRVKAFVHASLLLAMVGAGLGALEFYDQDLAFALLRFYWFRLPDVALPLGVALLGTGLALELWARRPAWGRAVLATLGVACAAHLAGQVYLHTWWAETLADQYERGQATPQPADWCDACRWIADSGRIPRPARFLTPLMSETFKWYTGRAEVVNWKEVPQDARSIVQWWQRVKDVCGRGEQTDDNPWEFSLAALGVDTVRQLGRKYRAPYVLTRAEPPLPLERLYRNGTYAVYKIK